MENILVLLGDGVNKDQVKVIYEMYNKRFLRVCQKFDKEAKEVPDGLKYILSELVIERYNYIGSEGMGTESFEGFTAKYVNKDINSYIDDITDYYNDLADGLTYKLGLVRFI